MKNLGKTYALQDSNLWHSASKAECLPMFSTAESECFSFSVPPVAHGGLLSVFLRQNLKSKAECHEGASFNKAARQ